MRWNIKPHEAPAGGHLALRVGHQRGASRPECLSCLIGSPGIELGHRLAQLFLVHADAGVGDDEADIRQGFISINSPIARALVGKAAGDEVDVAAPGGTKTYEIIDVRYV